MAATCFAARSVIGHPPSNCVLFQFIFERASISAANWIGGLSMAAGRRSRGWGERKTRGMRRRKRRFRVCSGKFPTMWAGLALKRGTLPSILSQRIIDRMESRSRSESPHTVFVNSAPIFRGTFGGSLLERISRTGQFGTSVDPRIEWENIE